MYSIKVNKIIKSYICPQQPIIKPLNSSQYIDQITLNLIAIVFLNRQAVEDNEYITLLLSGGLFFCLSYYKIYIVQKVVLLSTGAIIGMKRKKCTGSRKLHGLEVLLSGGIILYHNFLWNLYHSKDHFMFY